MKKDPDFYEDIISLGLIVTHQLHMSVVVSGDKSPFERPPREKQSYTSKYIDGGRGKETRKKKAKWFAKQLASEGPQCKAC